MKPGFKIALGVFTALLTMSFVVVYDLYIKDKIDSIEVVAVKAGTEIEKNEKIEMSKLSIELREKSSLIDGVITADKVKDILGVEAAHTLVGNTMLSEKMLNRDLLIPNKNEGEAVRPIPTEWIYATPGSLRRKDTIDIYVIKEEESKGTNVVSGNATQNSGVKMEGPVLKEVKVLYAKDNSNKEVIGELKTEGEEKRLDGTSKIAELELILNEEEFGVLVDYVVKEGYRLYVTYN